MTFGLEIRDASGLLTTTTYKAGGAVFLQKIEQEPDTGQTYTFTDIPGGAYLRVNQVGAGGHYYVVGTNGSNQATLQVIARSNTSPQAYQSSTFLIFATLTTEASAPFGVALFNESGERIASNLYNTPQFAYKVPQANWSLTSTQAVFAPSGYTAYDYTISFTSDGPGEKLIYFNLPVNSNNTWYAPAGSYSNIMNAFTKSFRIISNTTPVLPQAFLFRATNLIQSSGQMGLQIRNASGVIVFDSSMTHLVIEAYTSDVNYPLGNSPEPLGTIKTFPNVFVDNTSIVLVPHHFQTRFNKVPAINQTYVSNFTGAVRRNGTSLQTQMFHVTRETEDYVTSPQNIILNNGSGNGLFVPCLNGLIYGATQV